jgi:microsomal epoxide hydrolase
MALRFPREVEGLHLNLCFYRLPQAPFGSGLTGSDSPNGEEIAWAESEKKAFEREFQYFLLQAHDPLTLSYGLMDSPVGQAAWILDKFLLWMDRRGKEPGALFDRERALTEIMIYLVTDSFYNATSLYQAIVLEGDISLPSGERITVPVAFAAFPDPHCPPPPRSVVERSHNVVRWTDMPRGGHFPPLEEPMLLADDIAEFARSIG